MATVSLRVARASAGGGVLRTTLWAVVIVALGVAVALPAESQDALLGAVGAGAAVLAFIQPLAALPLLLLAVPFGSRPSTTDTTGEATIGAAELLVALLALAWLARGVRRRELTIHADALVVAILAMVALAGLSIGYAVDKTSAVKETLKWLEVLLALVIVVDLTRSGHAGRWIIAAMLVGGAAEAAYGAMQFATGNGPDFFEVGGALRAFGHFDQPNPFAGYLTTILPLAAFMTLSRANPVPYRWLSAGATGLIAIGIGLSQSRGAWLGAGVAAACLLLSWSARTRRLLVPCALAGVLAVALAVSGLLPASILDRLSQTIQYFGVFDVRTVEVTSENWAIVERMAHWQAGWYMFLAHPWLGVGAGNYAQAYPDFYVGSWIEPLGHAHDYYINMLAELGVVGGGLLVLLLAIAFRQLGGALVRSEDQGETFWRAVLAGAFGGLIVFCVHNLFDSLFVHSVNVQIGVLLGLGVVAVRQLRAHQAASL
jgi:O-antigen ligase